MQIGRRFIVVLLPVFFCTTGLVWAETLYISDQLVVSLREQPQDGAKAVTYLRTDTAVDVLGKEGDYYKVQTENNETGFISKNYLVENTPKSIIIKRLSQETETLKIRILELENQYKEATSKGTDVQARVAADLQREREKVVQLEKTLLETKSALQKVRAEHEALQENTKNVVAIAEERDQLKTSNQDLSAKLANIESERESVLRRDAIQWFLAGAGVLFLGWLLGKLSKPRRRSSF
jgi:SH3 domain protein